MKEVIIYTDGSAKGNPGNGGYGAVIIYTNDKDETVEKTISGGYPDTTNNRMEITAVIKALQVLTIPCKVKVYSDSQYLVNTFNKRCINNWKRNGWKTANGNDVKNKDLWEVMLSLTKYHKVKFEWVKGHAENKYNELCDKLATSAAEAVSKDMKGG
jgi:ribonuclease HI